jgi:hypothetical protein
LSDHTAASANQSFRAPKIRVEAGRERVNGFFRQSHRTGVEAEVDFGEVTVNLRGALVTYMPLAFRLSFVGLRRSGSHLEGPQGQPLMKRRVR